MLQQHQVDIQGELMNKERELYGYVYKTTLPDGRYYIGRHKSPEFDPEYYGSGRLISRYINKHGTDGVTLEILCWANTNDQLNNLEKEHIGTLYETDQNCINLRAGGDQCGVSTATRSRLRQVQLDYYKNGGINPNKGKPMSEEQKQKLRLANTGKKLTQEQINKRTASIKEYYKNGGINPNKGKTHTKQARNKMSLSLKGRKLSEEHKRKIGLANSKPRGVGLSKETKDKIRASTLGDKNHFYGKTHSEETKQLIRRSLKGRVCINNGVSQTVVPIDQIPEGWVRGKLPGRR